MVIPSDKELMRIGLNVSINDISIVINSSRLRFGQANDLYNAYELKKLLDTFIYLKKRYEIEYPDNDEIPF